MNKYKKVVSLATTAAILFAYTCIGNAAVDERLSVSAGGSTFSSIQTLLGVHTNYNVQLRAFKFSSNYKNVMPSGGKIYARIYTSTGVKAGDLATFTANSQTRTPGFWTGTGYGYGGSYKIKTNSNISYSYWGDFRWEP